MNKMKYLVVCLLLLATVACGGLSDKNSDEAQKVDLTRAVDDGRYDYVISELEGRSDLDKDLTMLLGKAYLGKSGVDFFEAFRIAGEADENSDPYTTMVAFLGVDQITKTEINNRKSYLDKGYKLLGFMNDDGTIVTRSSRVTLSACAVNDPDYLLMGAIAGAVDSIMSSVHLIIDGADSDPALGGTGDDPDDGSEDGDDPIAITKEALKAYVSAYLITEYGNDINALRTALEAKISDVDLEKLKLQVLTLLCGSDTLIDSDDLKLQFDKFIEQLTELQNGEQVLTKASFVDYIVEIIAELE